MFFGLFESKEAKFWRSETKRTLDDASYRFDIEDKKIISKNVLTRILSILGEIKGLNSRDKKDILFSYIDEVAKKRRNNVNELQSNNLNWVEDAMVESYLNMYCGFFGKKLAREAVIVIYWCRANLSEKDIDTFLAF